MKKLSILLAGVCLQSQRKSDKTTGQRTKKEHSGKYEKNIIIWEAEEAK